MKRTDAQGRARTTEGNVVPPADAAATAVHRQGTRELYLSSIEAATQRSICGDPEAALHAFLTLNAGYFLGEWLPARAHRALVRRLAATLDGMAGLPVPADLVHATQLAQHVRELTAEFARTEWTAALAQETAALVPEQPEDWNSAKRAATDELRTSGDAHLFLLAHARRRLWELAHPLPPSGVPSRAPAAAMRRAARAAATGDGHAIQLAEAILAET